MKKFYINDNPWQTRIGITRDDKLEHLYFDTHASLNLERCYFKGTVSKVLPGIQTAFVNIGQPKAGFLHISEIDRELAISRISDQLGDLESTDELHERPRHELDISKILRENEDILVQVSKEPVYEKGAKLTTCFTIPGRFIVLMPNIPRIGISKKIESREERHRLREMVTQGLPSGMGAIIRTNAENKTKKAIGQDLTYLLDIWKTIQTKFQTAKPFEEIYQDIDPVLQVVRDHLDDDVESVICDTAAIQKKVVKFVNLIAPEAAHKVRLYQGPPGLFERYNLEKQIEQALEKKVYLKSGGSLIIETTEAMSVIDVNTGRYTGQSKMEETILKTNLDAAEEVVRQLQLRNIGGLIVIDFIDMASAGNRSRLYRFLEKMLKDHDKHQSVVLKVSEFGLVQMTRKRSGKTLQQQMTEACQTCSGQGHIKSIQTEAFGILRKLKEELEVHHAKKNTVTLGIHPAVMQYITSTEYNTILELEKKYQCRIVLVTHEHPDHHNCTISIT